MSEPKKHSDFSSLAISNRRFVLKVNEIAASWRCSAQHTIDLIEEGKLNAFNVAGFYEYLRVPVAALDEIALAAKIPRETLLQIIAGVKPVRRSSREHWRVPVKEGFSAFIQENQALL
jgi:hypothetical protein